MLLEAPDDRLDRDLLRRLCERAEEQEKTLDLLRLGQAHKLTSS